MLTSSTRIKAPITNLSDKGAPTTTSQWGPLGVTIFRWLWIASIASNLGAWMQNVGATWLMTILTPSPILVALMQTATSLPVFLVGLPAGAIADVVDRRKLLLISQGWMLLVAVALGVLAALHLLSAGILLLLTFMLGLGSALNAPAWQAIVPELVGKRMVAQAVALNSAGFNLTRAVGPALGGLVVAAYDPSAVFFLNAASFLGVLVVVYMWKRPHVESVGPPENVLGAIAAGTRYASHSRALQAVLARVTVFIIAASALWALLPVVASHDLHLDAGGYGVLLGCLGVGAVIGALCIHKLNQILSTDQLTVLAKSRLRHCDVGSRLRSNPFPTAARTCSGRPGVDGNDVQSQRGCPARRSRLGKSARPRHLSAHLPGLYGSQQLRLGSPRGLARQ